jgi:cytochrome c
MLVALSVMSTRPMRLLSVAVMCGMLAGSVAGAAAGAEDAKAGKDVFESYCGDCHTIKEGKNKSGPSLFAVVGRQSASIGGFEYSEAMRGANVTWTAETLDTFLTNPKGMVAKTKMRFNGLSNEKARANLLAFLTEQK